MDTIWDSRGRQALVADDTRLHRILRTISRFHRFSTYRTELYLVEPDWSRTIRFDELQIWYIDHHIGLGFKPILAASDTDIEPDDALAVRCSARDDPEGRSRLEQRRKE